MLACKAGTDLITAPILLFSDYHDVITAPHLLAIAFAEWPSHGHKLVGARLTLEVATEAQSQWVGFGNTAEVAAAGTPHIRRSLWQPTGSLPRVRLKAFQYNYRLQSVFVPREWRR